MCKKVDEEIKSLYDHQKLYYDKLIDNVDKPIHSIVCIPTGGGKTRLAVLYAINAGLKRGNKVLWLAHSRYLLNQAFLEFHKHLGKEWMRHNSILIHSGSGIEYVDLLNRESSIYTYTAESVENIDNQNLIIASFQSLIRNNTWKSKIGENIIIFVDEAHHAVAKSYMSLLFDYTKDKQVIGLTATPIRSKSEENQKLYDYFCDDLGVRIHIATLFKNNILVRPIFKEVEYSMDTEGIHNVDELSSGLIKQIDNYNKLIFDKYNENKSIYGKTVIFAINIEHVNTLYDLFKKVDEYKDKVFRVHSKINDRDKQFENFKNCADGVLINVDIMNEGVDIPDIRTVFMTKPLNSRIRVTQAIGRALRKPRNVEKNNAYIVNFAVSNLGRKFLVVTPKLSYKMYEAEWEATDTELDVLEMEEKNVDELAELVQEVIKKKATCSFSNICLAGHYTLIDGDGVDIPVPVSFIEYRRIEAYISSQGKTRFPEKLFFCDEVDSVKEYIDKKINSADDDVELVFTKYDEIIFEKYEEVFAFIRDLYEKTVNEDLKIKEINKKISEFYKTMTTEGSGYGDLISYLSQIGANSEREFVKLVSNEFVTIKFEQ